MHRKGDRLSLYDKESAAQVAFGYVVHEKTTWTYLFSNRIMLNRALNLLNYLTGLARKSQYSTLFFIKSLPDAGNIAAFAFEFSCGVLYSKDA